MYSVEEKVRNVAILSRLGIIALQFCFNLMFPDHEAGVFKKPLDPDTKKTASDIFINFVLEGLTRWDGQYFLHIAEYGYTYENTLAFFPLFPLVVRKLSDILLLIIDRVLSSCFPVKDIISLHSTLILVGVLLNNCIFVKTSLVLYKLSLLVLKSEKLAYVSAILFCINPASIFFSAFYSESLYCFLTFYALLKIEEKNALVNYIIIGLTGAVRSNGLINVGFLVFGYIKRIFNCGLPFFCNIIFSFGIILSVLPFLFYQFYSFAIFCISKESVILPAFIYKYGILNNFVFPESNPPWCKYSSLFPLPYTYVQKHYWNVGFLNYYEIKQIPNFLLAAPMIYIIGRGSWSFAKRHKSLLFTLGLVDGVRGTELPISTFPYVLHAIFLTVFSIFMIHIQVATRLLASSSPVPYWFCARVIGETLKNPIKVDVLQKVWKADECFYENCVEGSSPWMTFLCKQSFNGYSLFIKWYFLVYFFVGTLMFSNHLPWT